MPLLYSVAFLTAGAIIGRILYLSNRLPHIPWWAGSGMTTCFNLIITALLFIGIALTVETIITWEDQVITGIPVILIVSMLAAAVVLWKLIGRALPEGETAVIVDGSGSDETPASRVSGGRPGAPSAPTEKAA